jgi:hypothetical protein
MEKKPTSAFAIVALVCGIIAFFSSIVPIINLFSFPFVLITLAFGIVAIVQAIRKTKGGLVMAIIGVALALFAWLITYAMYYG